MRLLASVQPVGGSSFRVVEVDSATGATIWSVGAPTGLSYHRPVASPVDGSVLWWQTVLGGSHDLLRSDSCLVVDGRPRTIPAGWTYWGHPEWGPAGEVVVAFLPTGSKAWRCAMSTDRAHTWVEVPGSVGRTEPSFTPDGQLVTVEAKRTLRVGTQTFTAPKGVDQLFDPFVSPDGRKVVALGRVGGLFGLFWPGWRLDVLDLATGGWTKILADSFLESVSAARWADDRTVITSRLLRSSAGRWDAWKIDIATGKASRLLAPAVSTGLGTIEYVAPALVAS